MLKTILTEKAKEDERNDVRKQEKIINRNKFVYNHNKTLEMQESLGIKINTPAPTSKGTDKKGFATTGFNF